MKVKTGMVFGDLIVRMRLPVDKKTKSPNLRHRVRVECSCGTIFNIPDYYLTRKQPAPKLSCGCKNKGLPTLHKEEYKCWYMMNVRCSDSDHVSYHNYGGRGIVVCERWSFDNPEGFANFLQDMPARPSRDFSLDRIRVNEGYYPGNVKWATSQEQANNQRRHLPPSEIEPSPNQNMATQPGEGTG
jgi:hypothetical protein